jgi:hypothetical protein
VQARTTVLSFISYILHTCVWIYTDTQLSKFLYLVSSKKKSLSIQSLLVNHGKLSEEQNTIFL